MSYLVGQTRCFAYIITKASMMANHGEGTPVTPVKRKLDALKAIVAQKALNYKVVRECALLEKDVVHEGRTVYNIVDFVERTRYL